MEGPQFSTLAESQLYRSWGMDIIGMTNLQEAKLAREAEICYSTIALVTDYDCWHPEHDQVTVDMIVRNLTQNARTAQQVIASAVAALPFDRTCECATALKHALITRPEAIPDETLKRLAPLVGKVSVIAIDESTIANQQSANQQSTLRNRQSKPCLSSSPARSPTTT